MFSLQCGNCAIISLLTFPRISPSLIQVKLSKSNTSLEAKNIDGFAFVWFTDGQGWNSARNNLEETFDVLDNMYCITDLENGIVKELFK